MDFEYSPKVKALQKRVGAFMESHVYPNQKRYKEEVAAGDRWQPVAVIEELKKKARAEELWNLFLPESKRGAGLTNLEYAPLCEIMGRVAWAPEVFNCSAPDTGNMETIERYGTEAQKKEWLEPLLEGKIRSCFAMTEPRVASSDATNIESRIERRGDSYIINGRKWWSSGAPDPRCKLFIFMGKTDPSNPEPPPAAVDDPGAARRQGRQDRALAAGVRLRRCPAWPCRSRVRERRGAGLQHAAGRRPRLRDRAGPAGSGAHPSHHARDRPGRDGAGEDVQAREVARRLRQADRRADGDAGAHR